MHTIPMAAPLYIVRQECEKDLFSTLKKLKEAGFDGIEFLGFFGHSAKEVKAMLDELSLQALGNHVQLADLQADPHGIFAFHQEVGCRYLTVAGIPMERILQDAPAVAAQLDGLAATADEYGIALLYHNHDEELVEQKNGVEALEILMDACKKETLSLEPDLGWIEIGLCSAEKYLQKYADRCPVIHLKDYYTSNHQSLGRVREFVPARGSAQRGHFEFRPTGYGVLNLPKLLPLCLACKPLWFVIDHDLAYERDPFADLKRSLDYTKNLLAIHQIG